MKNIPAAVCAVFLCWCGTTVSAQESDGFIPVAFELALPAGHKVNVQHVAYGNDGTRIEHVSRSSFTDESVDMGRDTAIIGGVRSSDTEEGSAVEAVIVTADSSQTPLPKDYATSQHISGELVVSVCSNIITAPSGGAVVWRDESENVYSSRVLHGGRITNDGVGGCNPQVVVNLKGDGEAEVHKLIPYWNARSACNFKSGSATIYGGDC